MIEETGIFKVEIITRDGKFYELQKALKEVGITGITVTNALGTGLQKGELELYRGVKHDSSVFERIKIEIVIHDVPVDTVIDVTKHVLGTGQPGDGKIFVYPIVRVVDIRTGNEGRDAL